MPLRVPLDASVRPVGNVLAVVYVTVPVPPLLVNAWLNATPSVPVAVAGLLTVIAAHGSVTALNTVWPFSPPP